MKRALIALLVVAVIVGGALVLSRDNKKTSTNNTNTTNTTGQQAQNTTPPSNNDQTAANTITYSSSFSPSTLTVKSGTTITIKNTSSGPVQFQSNPHPTHTDDPELNVGTVEAGQSQTFTVTNKGTFGYHNHLAASETGTIIVE